MAKDSLAENLFNLPPLTIDDAYNVCRLQHYAALLNSKARLDMLVVVEGMLLDCRIYPVGRKYNKSYYLHHRYFLEGQNIIAENVEDFVDCINQLLIREQQSQDMVIQNLT